MKTPLTIFSLSVLLGIFTISAYAQTPVTVTGKIYIDENRNHKFDSGERTLPDIWVTDGHTLCQSGSDGSYSLTLNPTARFVYIRIPAYYDPSGNFWHPLPCGPSADFGLIYRPDQPVTFIQTSDNEENIYREWMDELKAYIQNNPLGFVITTGDICYEKGLRMHAREFTTEKLGVRTHLSLGNHDLLAYGDYGEKLFEELFGPCWYSFDIANTHFIVFPMLSGDNPTGFKAKEIFDWIEQDLKTLPGGQKTVIIAHDLFLRDVNKKPMLVFRSDTLDLSGYPIEAYIHGHRHNQKTHILPNTSIKIYGTANANKGGRDHSPALYRLFELQNDGSITSQTRYTMQNGRLTANLGNGNTPAKLTAVAYHTPSDITSVVWEWEDSKGTNHSTPLVKSSDWAWSSPSAQLPSTIERSRVVATAADGSRFSQPVLHSERLIWSISLGGMTTIYPPLLAQGTLYITTYDHIIGSGNQICAVDPDSGNILWRVPVANSIASSMAYEAGRLFAVDVCGQLYAIDANSGKLLWRRQMFGMIPNTFQQGVVVNKGVVYICAGNTAMAMRSSDGETIWNKNLSPGTTNTSASTIIYGDVLLSGTHWSNRYALSTEDGRELWRQNTYGINNCEAAPTPYDGLLYYPGFEYLTVVDPKDGSVVQKKTIGTGTLGSASSPYVDNDIIVAGSSDRGLYAFSRDSLTQLWNFRSHAALAYTVAYAKDDQQSIEASPIVVDNVVYVGAADGYLYALDAPTGTFLWSFYAGAPLLSSPIYHNGYIYQTDMAGNLYKLIAKDLQ
jgi:FOG: WD40-like repeat